MEKSILSHFFLSKKNRIFVVVAIAGLLFAIAYLIGRSVDCRNSDFFSFWLAGHMVWAGEDPHLAKAWVEGHTQFGATWISDTRFLYPLPLAFFFAPVGLFSICQAFVIWVGLSETMLLFAVSMLVLMLFKQELKQYFPPFLAAAVLFRPTWLVLYGGQVSAWLLFLLVCVMWLWNMEKWFAGGVLLAWIGLKPNLGIPIISIVVFWLALKRRKEAIRGIVVSGLALVLAGMLWSPAWMLRYWSIGKGKLYSVFGYSPTLWGGLAHMTKFDSPKWIVESGILTAMIVIMAVALIVWKREMVTSTDVISLATAVTLFVTPYTWPYDQVLLLVPLLVFLSRMKQRAPYWIVASSPLWLDVLTVYLLVISARMQREVVNAVIPLLILLGVVYFGYVKRAPINDKACLG